jgi:hypothetical protein
MSCFTVPRIRIALLISLLCFYSNAFSQSDYEREELSIGKEISKPAKLNTRNFEKNLDKYAEQLDLSPKQVRKINRIERKYSRKETKMARRPSTKKKHLRALQKEKRERMIAVLDYEQQQRLAQISKKTGGFKDFFNQILGSRD